MTIPQSRRSLSLSLSFTQNALTRYFTLSLAHFFAHPQYARVERAQNRFELVSLSLSLFLWLRVILNKDFA